MARPQDVLAALRVAADEAERAHGRSAVAHPGEADVALYRRAADTLEAVCEALQRIASGTAAPRHWSCAQIAQDALVGRE